MPMDDYHTLMLLGVSVRRIPFVSEGESHLQCSSCSQDLTVTHIHQQTTAHVGQCTSAVLSCDVI